MSDLTKKISLLADWTDAVNSSSSIRELQDTTFALLETLFIDANISVFLKQHIDDLPPRAQKVAEDVSEMAVSVHVGDEIFGAVSVSTSSDSPLRDDDFNCLKIVADTLASRTESLSKKTDLVAQTVELKARSDRHEIIHQVGQTLAEVPTLKDAMQMVVEIVATGLRYARTAVLLMDTELEELELISAHGYGDVEGLRIPVSKGATGYAVRHREPVNIPDVTTDPRYVTGIRQGRSELAVPILGHNVVRGVIDVESTVINAFDSEDIHLLKIVSSYASAAISAAECREALKQEQSQRKRMTLEADLLGKVNQKLSQEGDPGAIFDDTLRLATDILGLENSIVWVVDQKNGALKANHVNGQPGFEVGARLPLREGTPGLAMKLGKVVKRYPSDRKAEGFEPVTRPEIALPLKNEAETIAVLHIVRDGEPFSHSELALLMLFGNQVTSALTSLSLKKATATQISRLDDRTRRLDLLNRVARSLTNRLELDELLDELLHLCAEAFSLSHVAVLLLDDEKKNLVLRASIGYDLTPETVIPIGEGITGHVISSGVPALQTDVTNDPRHIRGVAGSRSEMAVPLRVFDEVIGVLDAESIEVGAFDEADLDLFMSFAAQATIAIHNADLTAMLDRTKTK